MRRYHVTTFGCQMNAHDSERIKGLLEELGLGEAASSSTPARSARSRTLVSPRISATHGS
jgi:tRNA A37 methylthiotransferase MiaB